MYVPAANASARSLHVQGVSRTKSPSFGAGGRFSRFINLCDQHYHWLGRDLEILPRFFFA